MPNDVTAHLFLSVDGVAESSHLWQHDSFDDELGQMMGTTLQDRSDVVIGRKLYEEWAGYWPTASDPFADFINSARKHVASRTLAGPLEWHNSHLIDGDVVDFVREIRERSDGGILVAGGIETVRNLFLAGVVDRLILTLHPVIAGSGRRLFPEGIPATRLALVDSQTTSKGNVILTYGIKK